MLSHIGAANLTIPFNTLHFLQGIAANDPIALARLAEWEPGH
jgi:hypothetical protein